MKIVSFNVNGIRARLHQLEKLVEKHKPDIIAIQETKCVDDAFPASDIEKLGYHYETFGQKGHYGVAILSLNKPLKVTRGYPDDDENAQKRIISATFPWNNSELTLINGYFPQGESREHPTKFPAKQKFYADLLKYLNSEFTPKDNVAVVGDMNVAPKDIDVKIGEQNAKRWLKSGKCCFLPEERKWLNSILDWGLKDLYRELYPELDEKVSWFDYRSKGFDDEPKRGLRIDLILGTDSLMNKALVAGIDYEIRGMTKPSDHAPVWVELKD